MKKNLFLVLALLSLVTSLIAAPQAVVFDWVM